MPLPPDDPRHGTRQGGQAEYKLGEKPCELCAPATYLYEKQARLRRDRGEYQLVELGEEAWTYLQTAPRIQVARASGVSVNQVDRLRKATPGKVTRKSTRDAILAARAASFVTPVGVHRRVRALAALGWSAKELHRRSGIWLSTFAKLRTHEPQIVKQDIADAVRVLYDDLCMQIPPHGVSAGRTRYWAHRNGYLPPLAWDNIDDPNETPDRRLLVAA